MLKGCGITNIDWQLQFVSQCESAKEDISLTHQHLTVDDFHIYILSFTAKEKLTVQARPHFIFVPNKSTNFM